ncbi:hypothetical protein H310_09305 [Aphanomyces invadans]|uniref:Uncharacterized protein n=1 Tax=Aphanomyces invadans TaxID=157072 RepID=A0A024TVK2_9STRA|nr:hypothetical protein H310_09305 [Aphanomyces invadans]ETV98004.1 hypothetical protein H310_09305 [Aphanomyces invadans]|eukprot:XP_008873565.1 hypothetical protein H310_09305 [Aphanomyces invadans]
MPPPTLRIRAIGARNVAAKTGLAGMFEAKMNAYVVVVIGAEEKHLPVVKNVGAKEFAWGDDAVVEFAWPDASSEIKLHLKDKDTAKERYVGGAKLAFPTDITSLPVARTIDLEFSDEKLKTKKGRGQLLLSFERVGGTSDTNPTGAVQAATTAATSTATPHAPSSPAGGHVKHMLRIQAIGGGNLAPKTGLVKMLDANPDPYLVLTVAGVTKTFPALNNVKTNEFSWGDDAVHEFPVDGDAVDVIIHCKDKDTIKDHYIGGAQWRLTMADMLANPTWKQTVELDFASPDFKTKAKASQGKIHLHFVLLESGNPLTRPTEPPTVLASAEVQAVSPTNSGPDTKGMPGTADTIVKAEEGIPSPTKPATTSETILQPGEAPSPQDIRDGVLSATQSSPKPEQSPAPHLLHVEKVQRMLRVQAIGGANLAPKTGLEHLMDANPDPYLVLTVAGVTKTFPALNNVKTNEFSWGDDAVHEFPVDGDAVDVIIHCKDKDTIKDRYIGGAKLSIRMADIMAATPSWKQTVELEFATPDLTTKAKESRGTIYLGFTLTDPTNATSQPPGQQRVSTEIETKHSSIPSEPKDGTVPAPAASVPQRVDVPREAAPQAAAAAETSEPSNPAMPAPDSSATKLPPTLPLGANFKRTLRVQAVGGRNLAPKTGLNHIVDCEPDPYLIVIVGSTTKLYPVVDNVKTKEFAWGGDAVHEFVVPATDDSIELSIHCKDKDILVDHYIGGARVVLPVASFGRSKTLENQTVCLDYVDASFQTKAPHGRGVLILSYFLVETPLPNSAVPPIRTLSPRKTSLSARLYKGTLRLIAHSAKHLTLPPQSRVPGVPDKHADPYVVFQVGPDRIACPEAINGHFTPTWSDAKHTFQIDTSQHAFVEIAIFDKKRDRFMAATRLRLVDVVATLTNHIQATVVVKLDCDQTFRPVDGASGGDLQLSLLFTPWNPNQVTWKGAAVGHIQISSLSLSNYADVVPAHNQVYLEISVRRHASAIQGHLSFQTKTIESNKSRLTWPDDVLWIPYALFLHPNMTKDKCPVVVFALHDKHAIARDKPLVQNSISLVDVLGWHGSKQVPLLHSKLPGRPTLAFSAATTAATTATQLGQAFATTPGTLRLFVLGAHSLSTVLTWQNVRAVVTSKAFMWGRGDCALDKMDATADGLVVWNSAYEAQYLPAHVKSAESYVLLLQVTVGTAVLGPIELPVLQLLDKHGGREFDVEIVQDNLVVCRVALVLGFTPLESKADIVSPRTSCIDFGPGSLHLVVYKAEGLVPDHDVDVDDIDPEVRVALKPRPVTKQKDGRSSAKTRPLENAGRDPVWNEYLKLDYTPNKDPTAPHVSPMVVFSINDIQMPGETREMNVVGVAEVPLASFVVATPACSLFSTKLTLERNGQPTGTILIAGIYESKTAPEAIRNSCHSHGQKLRLATPSLSTFVDSSYCPGRLDIHVAMAKDLNQNPHVPYRCELCLSSCVDSRMSLQSRQPDSMATTTDIVWDYQLTLYTQTAKADFLRLDLFQGPTLVGWAKVPLSTYCQEPTKSFREYHDVVLTARDTTAIIKPRIMLELTFFTDQTLQTFVDQTALALPTAGVLYVTLDSFDSRHTAQLAKKKLSLRVTLLHVTATDGDPDASKQVAMFPFQVLSDATLSWQHTVALVCPADLTRQTTSKGTCPLLRYELIDGSSAFGKDAISRDEMAIQSLLLAPKAVITKRLPNSTIATDREPLGFSKLRLVYVPQGAPSSLPQRDANDDRFHEQFTDVIQPNRGTLSIRVISGRNLADVDVLGEQDPYVQLQLDPPTYQLMPGCVVSAQSGVCVNGGRHPQWNSPVYNLSIHDSNVEIVTIRVLDSGEEDNVPDAMIGACHLSVYSLIQMSGQDGKHQQRWSEGWFNLFHDQEPAGELRLEYRFVPDNATRVCMEPPTKYINCLGGRGKMAVKVLSGTNLPCVSGMVPAVRVFVESTKFSYVTQPEKRHIVHPTWNETVMFDMEWTPELTSARTIRMELVDLGAGVASQLPILAHCTIHAAAFVVHPLETHFGTYPLTTFQLQKGQSTLADVPSLHLAIQFLPFDTTVQPFDDPFVAPEPGQIHVNVTSAAFRTNDAFRPFVRCTLRHDAVSQTKATPPCVSDLGDYSFCEWKAPLLFDFTMPDRDSHHILPSLHFQVLCHSDNADDAPVLGELDNVPLFPFVMHKGHVDVVWYPVCSKSAAVVAQVKVEVQFLKTSPVPKTTFTDVLTVQVVEGRAVWSAQDTTIDATDAQDPFVELDFLGHHVQTKAHIDGGTDPAWHETFELPLLGLDSTVLPVLTVSVRNQDVKRKGDGTIGASRFVVPKEVLYDGKLRDVWLPLSSDAAGAATDTELGKIHLRLKRGQLDKSGFVDAVSVTSAGEDTKESPNLAGVLYTYGSKPWEVRAAFQRPDATLPAYTAFRLVEMGVLPVPWQDEPLKRNLPHNDLTFLVESPKTNQCIALGPDDVRAILHTPRREFHYTSNESKASAGHGNEASPAFEISVVYMPPTQGLVQISIDHVDGVPVVHGTSYFVEFRVLRNSPWVKSPSVRAKVEDKTDQTIAWQPHAVREMQYSNFREHTPPLLQVVLYAQSKATSTRTKVGFGQLNLLQYIAMPAKYVNEVVPITCVGRNHNRSDDKATATVAIEFVPGVATSPDDAEAKALQLAEGTAAMKKAFLSLGGDECTPLDIDRLKEAAATDSASMHMLQSAAKLVGGLDALFAAMDTNKDGKISWEEYLDRMQFVHALADEASTKPANLQPSNPLDVEELENDTDEDDDSKVDKDEPAQSKNASGALSSPPWKPPKSPSRIHYSDYSDDDDDGIDDAPSIMAASKGPSIHSNPAIAPMVALSVDDAVKASSVSRVTLAAAPRKPQQQGPDESAVASWKVADVSAWLEVDVELPQYIPAFMDASVDGHLLLSLTPDDMDQHFQIQQPLHRRKLLARIQQLQEKFSAASAVNRFQDTKGGESAVNAPEEEPRSTRGTVVRKPNDRPPQGPRPPVDLNAKGHHEIERSKLAYKAQSKKKTQRRDQREADEATKRWTFEYTGAAKPKRVQTAIEKVAAVMAKDEQTRSGYEGAMEQVLEQVAPPRLEMPLVANTDEIIEVLKQAIWRHAEALEVAAEHQAALDKDAASDFGDDEDEKKEDMAHPVSGLERVFADLCALKNNGARWLHDTAKLSRLKFEGGLMALLGIHMSWHQFDLVFRRLDAANEGEISWSAFSAAFGDPTPGNAMSNDMLAVKEGLVLMIERLEEHDLTLHQAWQAFDRDNSGAISVAEFATLIRFLTYKEGVGSLSKHQIYLMMAALDTSCDRLIQYPEFVKFIYIVWSHRLLQLQEYLSHEDATATHNQDIVKRKVKLRKALRTNFSRPFRDAMRCSPVTIPGPFHGLLEKFHLQPPSVDGHMQIWQVLKGETSHRDKAPAAMAPKPDKPKKATTGQNTVVLAKLKRQRTPKRDKCVLRAPVPVDLDDYQELIYDLKSQKLSQGNAGRVHVEF